MTEALERAQTEYLRTQIKSLEADIEYTKARTEAIKAETAFLTWQQKKGENE